MERRGSQVRFRLLALVGAAWLCALAVAAPARAQAPSFLRDCGRGWRCGHVAVPLDRGGNVPGTLQLALKVHPPLTRGPVNGALVALAGGPGQAATPLADDFLYSYAPALRSRELVVFDQRGTGHSGALACSGLGIETTAPQRRRNAARCAAKLGAARPFYTTRDSADDIESIRRALGVDGITVAGTSYGTKVALAYAKRHPGHVERLVLDSVVPLDEHPFMLPTFGRIPVMLRDECSLGLCRGITGSPVGDVAKLVKRLDRRSLAGRVVLPSGRPTRMRIDEEDLVSTVIAGDLDPTVLADLPGSVKAALRGDAGPILRLVRRANAVEGEAPPEIFSDALQFATVCEEAPLPWPRTAPLSERPTDMRAALAAIPASDLYPFSRIAARWAVEDCLLWPQAPQPPDVGGGPMPDVPVLIYSGQDDVRTPLQQAEEVAAQFPRASLVQVPFTGHSVLSADVSGCSTRALHDFFGDRPVRECGRGIPLFPPAPVPPPSLSHVHGLHGAPRGAGLALDALQLTFADAISEAIATALTVGPGAHVRVGGLRAGRMEGVPIGRMRLHGYSYVPRVRVSGTIRLARLDGTLTVSGPASVRGSVRIRKWRVTGVLAGVALHRFPIAKAFAASGRGGRALAPREVRALLRLAARRAAQAPPRSLR